MTTIKFSKSQQKRFLEQHRARVKKLMNSEEMQGEIALLRLEIVEIRKDLMLMRKCK